VRLFSPAAFAASAVLAAGAAMAQPAPTLTPTQPPPPPSTTYKSLMDKGFEIKNILYLSDTASTRLATAVQPETVMVTLQKGPVTAACWIDLADWQRQTVGNLTCNVMQ
jgi:hypothetical protein